MKRCTRNILIVCIIIVCAGGEILDTMGIDMYSLYIGTFVAGFIFAAISKVMWKKRFNQYWYSKGCPERAINYHYMFNNDWKTGNQELDDRYRSSNYFILTIVICEVFDMIKAQVIYGLSLK